MKNINKTLITLISIISCIINFSLAITDNSDCGQFASLSFNNWNWFSIIDWARETDKNQYSNFLDINQQTNILYKKDLNVAMINLKKYCCEKELWWLEMKSHTCQDDKKFFNDNALDSPYLFDHLFDIQMRRLNWLTWDNDIYKNMTQDPKWEGRRSFINEKAENLSGSDAQSIIDEYNKVWEQSPSMYNITDEIYGKFQDSYPNFLTYVSGKWDQNSSESVWSKKVAKALQNYNERTIYDRYINTCALTEYFYSLLAISATATKDKDKIIKRLSNSSCDKMVAKQIDWENAYTQLIVQRASNLFLSNYVKWYIRYLYDRENKLKSIQKNSSDRFLDIVRAVPHLVKQCVK